MLERIIRENLKEDMVIRNYKELCSLLDWKITNGKSKKLQLEDLERYIEYKKDGNKFVILKIKDMPDEKIDKRIEGNNSIYQKYIEEIILYMCKNTENKNLEKIELSVSGMLYQLEMINSNFNVGRQQMRKFSQYLEIPIQTIYDFYNSTYTNLANNIVRTLNKIENRCLIDWQYITKIKTIDNVHRLANDIEVKQIKEIERSILKELNYKDKKSVFLSGNWNKFSKSVSEKLRDKCDIDYSYKAFKIITTNEFKDMIINSSADDIISAQQELNCLVQEGCNKSATNRHLKTLVKYKDVNIIYTNEKDVARIRPEYINDSKKVTDICIDRINKFSEIDLGRELSKINNNCEEYDLIDALLDVI